MVTSGGCRMLTISRFFIDQDLSFIPHIKQVSRSAFFHLCNIAQIRSILSQDDAEKLVDVFITSRLDYCNSLLSGF